MLEDQVFESFTDSDAPGVEDLCDAMFLEGARFLGFAFAEQPMPLEAQEKIQQAANALSEKLMLLTKMQKAVQCETELGN
jgi:hypothetical protein